MNRLRLATGLLLPAICLISAHLSAAEKEPVWERAVEDTYPGGELLVEPAWAARPEFAREFILLDARDQESFQQERIPRGTLGGCRGLGEGL